MRRPRPRLSPRTCSRRPLAVTAHKAEHSWKVRGKGRGLWVSIRLFAELVFRPMSVSWQCRHTDHTCCRRPKSATPKLTLPLQSQGPTGLRTSALAPVTVNLLAGSGEPKVLLWSSNTEKITHRTCPLPQGFWRLVRGFHNRSDTSSQH